MQACATSLLLILQVSLCTSFIEGTQDSDVEKFRILAKETLKTQHLPDVSGRSYTIYDIKINDVNLAGLQVTDAASQGLKVSVIDASCTVTARWKFRKGIFWGKGGLVASVKGVRLTFLLSISLGINGELQFTVHDCESSVDDVDIRLHGGLMSKIISLWRRKIERKAKAAIPGKLCEAIRKRVNKGQQAASTSSPMHFHTENSAITTQVVP